MIEGIRINPPHRQPRVLAKLVAGIDYLVPLLDIGYVFFWIPGVILFIFGYPLLFSWWSMLVLPITLFVFGLLRGWQDRNVFRVLDARPEPDRRGFWGYLLGYQALTSTASLRGYAQQLTGAARRWKIDELRLRRPNTGRWRRLCGHSSSLRRLASSRA